jgi:acylphosphatase
VTAEPAARVVAEVHGLVQGVGFRFFVCHRATELGLGGTVRNLPSGAVRVEAEGPRASLETLIRHLHEGPAAARVERVRVEWERPRGIKPFTIAHG